MIKAISMSVGAFVIGLAVSSSFATSKNVDEKKLDVKEKPEIKSYNGYAPCDNYTNEDFYRRSRGQVLIIDNYKRAPNVNTPNFY